MFTLGFVFALISISEGIEIRFEAKVLDFLSLQLLNNKKKGFYKLLQIRK